MSIQQFIYSSVDVHFIEEFQAGGDMGRFAFQIYHLGLRCGGWTSEVEIGVEQWFTNKHFGLWTCLYP